MPSTHRTFVVSLVDVPQLLERSDQENAKAPDEVRYNIALLKKRGDSHVDSTFLLFRSNGVPIVNICVKEVLIMIFLILAEVRSR